MIIDLHNHTTRYSLCSRIIPEVLVEIYVERGIDGLCITEHNSVWPEESRRTLTRGYENEITIFFGMEVDTEIGHVLLFGEGLERFVGIYNLQHLAEFADKEGVALVWAHPFRWSSPDHFSHKKLKEITARVDAVELYNGNLAPELIELTGKTLTPYGVNFTGGSDTHSSLMALKYATKFETTITNSTELAAALKEGLYSPYVIYE